MFEKPTIDNLRRAADRLGMHPTVQYLDAMQKIVAPLVQAYAAHDTVPDEKPVMFAIRSSARSPFGGAFSQDI